MRIIIINHFFDQDIDALINAKSEHKFKIIPHTIFLNSACKYFPRSVFANLEEYHKPVYSEARNHWRIEARKKIECIYYSFPFDIIISPSDTFFYIRDLVNWAQEKGIPFFIVQKETTISPYTMSVDSKSIGRFYPLIADFMAVCSTRHKNFWIAAGANPDKICVTGQPRFDFYSHPEQRRSLAELGLQINPRKKKILYLSYDKHAYMPDAEELRHHKTSWAKLRDETEQELLDLLDSGEYQLIIKPHPQQDISDYHLWLQTLTQAQKMDIFLVPGQSDTRQLIINTDVVVGFQTTVLFEAMIMNKTVIYTFWGDEVLMFENCLIPFHQYADVINCARSPDELRQYIINDQISRDKQSLKRRRSLYEKHLGSIDGGCTQRVLDFLFRGVMEYKKDGRRIKVLKDFDERIKAFQIQTIFESKLKLWIWIFIHFFTKTFVRFGVHFSLFSKIKHKIERHQNRIAELQLAKTIIVRRWRMYTQEKGGLNGLE